MSAPLDAPPYRSDMTEQSGVMSGDWTRWFQLFWARVGSAVQLVGPTPALAARTNQTTSTSGTAYTVTLNGLYRVSYRQRVTTPATVSSSLTMTIGWRESSVTQSQAGAAMTGNTTTTQQNGTLFVRADSGTVITYTETYASVGATPMVFNFDVTVELVS